MIDQLKVGISKIATLEDEIDKLECVYQGVGSISFGISRAST